MLSKNTWNSHLFFFLLRNEPDFPTQPPLLTFKQYLTQQDDAISEEDAIKRYNDYKIDFKRQQISEFFLTHKEEEWWECLAYTFA